MTSAPILAVLDSAKEFMVCTDASLDGIGAVLMQEGHVIAYESRKLKSHEVNRSQTCCDYACFDQVATFSSGSTI